MNVENTHGEKIKTKYEGVLGPETDVHTEHGFCL